KLFLPVCDEARSPKIRWRISFKIDGLPPAKNEAKSMLADGHSHSPRVAQLLSAAKRALDRSGLASASGKRLSLRVDLRVPPTTSVSDATNYLGGIADVLQRKTSKRGMLTHLGELADVALFDDDCNIKEISFRQSSAKNASYVIHLAELG